MKIVAMNAQDMAMITIMMLRQTAMKRLAMIVRITGGRMMTNDIDRIECAIRHIQTAVDIDPWAMEIAVEAMQKQIPKKPVMGYAFPEKLREVIKINDAERAESKTDCCPKCGRTLGVSQFVKTQTGLAVGDKFCKRCGQAIDWMEGEE